MEGSVTTLAKYRYDTSLETLEDAKIMLENGRYKNDFPFSLCLCVGFGLRFFSCQTLHLHI